MGAYCTSPQYNCARLLQQCHNTFSLHQCTASSLSREALNHRPALLTFIALDVSVCLGSYPLNHGSASLMLLLYLLHQCAITAVGRLSGGLKSWSLRLTALAPQCDRAASGLISEPWFRFTRADCIASYQNQCDRVVNGLTMVLLTSRLLHLLPQRVVAWLRFESLF